MVILQIERLNCKRFSGSGVRFGPWGQGLDLWNKEVRKLGKQEIKTYNSKLLKKTS
jgi:hypothetical protein